MGILANAGWFSGGKLVELPAGVTGAVDSDGVLRLGHTPSLSMTGPAAGTLFVY